ncbi:PIN domain-containing protein [Cellulomonas edaphi]|uniref:PIN domain-containing protein n=1 Tax=Cellulomonas edaphi TaxID=3053468 RepID=A0ABT7S3V6_9CELL|nr:hypothetical protein [Cellulomons edaphi]MDM7830307.1 hypothetical protein [Cellulomons edaphi]
MPQGPTRIYADGSALSRYLPGAPHGQQWTTWADEHLARLVTSPLGITELRGIARMRGGEAPAIAADVAFRVPVARFSDQAVRKATDVSGVLLPFVALHVGIALADPDVDAVATYDVHLARVAALYGLTVVTPGRVPRWWEVDPTPWVA